MYHLPFNPEPLLTLFMTKENAGSLVGDLEERFERICHRNGRTLATLWFSWEFLISVPPILIAAVQNSERSARITVGIPLRIGSEVSIIDGALAGFKGTVLKTDEKRKRVVVKVFFLQRSVPVETQESSVVPCARQWVWRTKHHHRH
jgi:transcription antitermination factor NusG